MVLFLCKILLEVKMKGEMFNMNIEELNTQLDYLDETKSLIKQAIIDKGQSISENDTFRNFVQKINDIETGIETANIPVWFTTSSTGTTEIFENAVANKIQLGSIIQPTHWTRLDTNSTTRTEPLVDDFVVMYGGFNEGEYIYLSQIVEIAEHTAEEQIYACKITPIFGTLKTTLAEKLNITSNVLKAGTTILDVSGKSTIVDTEEDNNAATSGDVVYGKIAYVNGQQITGTIESVNSITNADPMTSTYTEAVSVSVFNATTDNTSNVILPPNTTTQVAMDKSRLASALHLTADKLKKNETILGITGTLEEGIDTSDATAVASDMAEGKTAYVNGQKITGSLQLVDSTHPAQNIDPINVTGHTMMMSNIFILQATCDTSGVGALILKDNDPIYIAVKEPVLAGLISLTAGKIKSGETILGITGTYSDAMKEYASETAMNNDIANIQEGEVVKVVVTSGIAGDVDNPLTTTTTHYIKETTMKKLVKEEDTISPQE